MSTADLKALQKAHRALTDELAEREAELAQAMTVARVSTQAVDKAHKEQAKRSLALDAAETTLQKAQAVLQEAGAMLKGASAP